MLHFFCPYCWCELKENEKICSKCGRDISNYSLLPYDEKLLLVLNHPVKEIRKTVVHLLGLKRLPQAVYKLEKMLDEEEDPMILIEIINTLKKYRDDGGRECFK
ncbi:HEAT repeat domain-containing protein [Thermodesulfovibrio hydrogeniphilus]